jgi:glycolate oxidase
MAALEDADTELRHRLISVLGNDAVLTELSDLMAYASDALVDAPPPVAVVLPRSADDVVMTVRIAATFERSVTPRGAGTGMTGGAVAVPGGILLSTVRMNRILLIDALNRRARVQAGVVTLDLSYAAAPYGLFFAPDPASQRVSTIGGNFATNAGGPHAFAYGSTTDQTLAVEYVDAAGQLRTTALDDGGFDLCGLLAGSEGTLGIVTTLDLRLRKAPESIRVGVASFQDLESAIEASTAIRERCTAVVALELLDELALVAIAATSDSPYPRDTKAIVLVEFAGLVEDTRESEERAEVLMKRYAADGWMAARTAAEAQRLWSGRHEVRKALSRISPDLMVHDFAIPRSRIMQAVRALSSIAEQHRLHCSIVAHAGDGSLHPILLYDRSNLEENAAVEIAGEEMLEAILTLGGGAGEYGIGFTKREIVYRQRNRFDCEALRLLRNALDPHDRLNPEKLAPPPTLEIA